MGNQKPFSKLGGRIPALFNSVNDRFNTLVSEWEKANARAKEAERRCELAERRFYNLENLPEVQAVLAKHKAEEEAFVEKELKEQIRNSD